MSVKELFTDKPEAIARNTSGEFPIPKMSSFVIELFIFIISEMAAPAFDVIPWPVFMKKGLNKRKIKETVAKTNLRLLNKASLCYTLKIQIKISMRLHQMLNINNGFS